MEEVQKLKGYAITDLAGAKDIKDKNFFNGVLRCVDTIEAQQQEIEKLIWDNQLLKEVDEKRAKHVQGLHQEIESLRNWNACEAEDHERLLESDKRRIEMEEETDRLHRWVSDLQRGTYVNCVYCGHRYGPESDTPSSMADVLKEHIEQCTEHPMSKLKQEFEQLKAQAAEMREALVFASARHPKMLFIKALSSDAGKDYHNPADVEALKQMREGLNKISEEALFSSFGDEICKLCPWTRESHHPELVCEGCSCEKALEIWKEGI